MDIFELNKLARQIRAKAVQMSHAARAAHLASSLSCVDILVAAYWTALDINPKKPYDPNRDRLILSKGHAAQALYATLAQRGFFDEKLLSEYGQDEGSLSEHPAPNCAPGVEAATGSLGHGLPIGVGLAIAARIQKCFFKVFVVMSDGECNEGSVWEAAMLAPAQKLENLLVIVDYNKWQATDQSNDVMQLEPLVDKWRAFGWNTCEVDGHDIKALSDGMSLTQDSLGKPTAIIAHTIKGKGISFMEDDNNWHYRIPTKEEVALAFNELGIK